MIRIAFKNQNPQFRNNSDVGTIGNDRITINTPPLQHPNGGWNRPSDQKNLYTMSALGHGTENQIRSTKAYCDTDRTPAVALST